MPMNYFNELIIKIEDICWFSSTTHVCKVPSVRIHVGPSEDTKLNGKSIFQQEGILSYSAF